MADNIHTQGPPTHTHAISSLSIHLPIDIWVASMSWLLWIVLNEHVGAYIFPNYSFLQIYA